MGGLFEKAFFKHIKDSFHRSPDFVDENTFDRVVTRIWEDFEKTCRKSVHERVKMGHFLTILRPYELSTATFRHFGNVSKDSKEEPKEIEEGHLSPVTKDFASKKQLELRTVEALEEMKKMMTKPTTEPQFEETRRQSFFEDHDFFKGFGEELDHLGYDDRYQLYGELHDIATAYDVPIVKEVKE